MASNKIDMTINLKVGSFSVDSKPIDITDEDLDFKREITIHHQLHLTCAGGDALVIEYTDQMLASEKDTECGKVLQLIHDALK
jgi:hypothetical protein